MVPLLIVGGILLVVVFFVIGIYNSLAQGRQKIKEASADIDTQLKRRFDLIPNIVETVKGYAKHESTIFEDIAKLRAQSISGGSMEEKAKVSDMLTNSLKTLFAVAENYPELKANENFLNLQSTLQQIEGDIQNSRRYYNGSVRDFNNRVVTFPANIVAGMFGFTEQPYFEAAEGERENVKVQF